MAERTSGAHKIVTIPMLYGAIQRTISGPDAHQTVADRLFASLEGKSVVEIGCGPGTWAPHLSHAREYTGIDRNGRHIALAHEKHGSNQVRFVCGDLADPAVLAKLDKCDAVIGMGILHHLDDPIARDVLAQVASILRPGGRYIGNEPVFHARQHPVARLLKWMDSGKNIRSEEGYRTLFQSSFSDLDTQVVTDLARLPYSHCMISAVVTC